MTFSHVLIATDFSEASLKALEYLNQCPIQAQKFTLLHVLTDWEVPVGYYEAFPSADLVESWREKARKHCQEKVSALVREYAKSRNMEGISVFSRQHAASEITAFAASHSCDLLIMGSKGASALATLTLGSVVQSVIGSCSCPVMILPAAMTVPYPETNDDI
jgi:nucleotide-binding universal stress UspA family protein